MKDIKIQKQLCKKKLKSRKKEYRKQITTKSNKKKGFILMTFKTYQCHVKLGSAYFIKKEVEDGVLPQRQIGKLKHLILKITLKKLNE